MCFRLYKITLPLLDTLLSKKRRDYYYRENNAVCVFKIIHVRKYKLKQEKRS